MKINLRSIYLFLAGATLTLVGAYIGFLPSGYLEHYLSVNEFAPDFLSEIRGMGGTLFISGVFVFAGAFIKQIETVAMVISALIFVSFSVFRSAGLLLDGLPGQSVFIALFVEVLFAALVIALLAADKQCLLKA